MKSKPNQLRALGGIIRASLIATYRNPSSLVFGLIFPMIFIVIFGFLGNEAAPAKLAVRADTHTDNPIYTALKDIKAVELKTDLAEEKINEDLSKGNLDASIKITAEEVLVPAGGLPRGAPIQQMPARFKVELTTSKASPQNGEILRSIVDNISGKINLAAAQIQTPLVETAFAETEGRRFSSIDFILPGQLGFSLLNIGVFATVFTFLTLKQTLVIKRFFTTPVKKITIIAGEAISRLLFSLIQAAIIIAIGYYGFHYTLIYGWATFGQLMVLVALGLIVFLGFGLVISSIAKDERSASPLANILTIPQFLLAGTFFPIEMFPQWLQPIGKVLPLTFLNDSLRKVAFEGQTLVAVAPEIGWLALWGVGIYVLTMLVFKWE